MESRKTAFIQKIRIEPGRLKRYKKAYKERAKAEGKGSGYLFSDWVRDALDSQADLELQEAG